MAAQLNRYSILYVTLCHALPCFLLSSTYPPSYTWLQHCKVTLCLVLHWTTCF